MKQVRKSTQELVSLSVRVDKGTADKLKVIADREYRPVAAHIRWLLEDHIKTDELREAA